MIVQPIGRLFFLVSSQSRKDVWHVCDFEPTEEFSSKCSCEAWSFAVNRPCKHLRAAANYLRNLAEREAKKNNPRVYVMNKKTERKFRKRK